ncbi:hypothetical protein HPB49_026545 [Dermacentor silvarum]|nr:hypothetical protein HPB49_026545 [Dermacentor silvarum]
MHQAFQMLPLQLHSHLLLTVSLLPLKLWSLRRLCLMSRCHQRLVSHLYPHHQVCLTAVMRIVRFNNRDLESLRKIQDELNTRKSGGVPRSPGSPIVIRAELTSPHKGVSAQAPQVLVVQKPSPGCSPKKADIRVIHPPGLTVRRQLQMSVPAASGGGTTSAGLTKVILQPAGQLMSGATFQFVGAMAGAGGQAAQPTLVLSSPTRATPVRTATGQQLCVWLLQAPLLSQHLR